ncbi:MAG: ABC transporter permease [Planctomycetes bacterium]|nr:ABC transporter permease [Planctomycetota bacterium]
MALPLSYHWRNLFVRKNTTILTVLVIAAVVGVFTWMIGFRGAVNQSLSVAGEERKIIVLKKGATAESNSAIPIDEYNKLGQLNSVEKNPATGQPRFSPEMIIQVSLPRLADGGMTFANVAVRGVTDDAFVVHSNVKELGTRFSVAEREVIVGVAASKQFGGLNIGDIVNIGFGGDRGYKVVGYFSADGGPMESEIWGYLPSLMNAYNRTMYSSVSLRLTPDADPKEVIAQIEGPAIQLTGKTEKDYWKEQTKLTQIYLFVTGALVAVMSIAAVFAIANTMYAVVAGRTREIAMLRTIGFDGYTILRGLILESVMVSLMGGIIGCLGCAAWLEIAGNTKDMFGATTFTTMAFEIHLTPVIVVAAMIMVTLLGVVGALMPGLRAARLEVLTALREA